MNLWLSLSVNCRDGHAPTISADVHTKSLPLSERKPEKLFGEPLQTTTPKAKEIMTRNVQIL